MTARPAPLTPEQEAACREHGVGLYPNEARQVFAMLDATRAQLAETRATLDTLSGLHEQGERHAADLSAQLAAVTGERDKMRTALANVRQWIQSSLGSEGSASMYRKLESARYIIDAALSPTQPTPTEGNES